MTDSPDFARTPIVYSESFVTAVTAQEQNGTLHVDLANDTQTERSLEARAPSSSDPPREYYCGIGKWHPRSLQVFRNAKFFTFILTLNTCIEGALVSGFTSVVLSTIERRYRFSSVAAGAIASTFDVAVLLSVLFHSYFGGRSHKPRWLGVSLIVQAVGAFVFALPQFVFGSYDVGQRGTLQNEACADGEDFSSECDPSNALAFVFFIAGNLLIGVGAAPLFTVGTSYLDDIVHPKYVSVHLGVFYLLAAVGPALGFALGGLFLSIYVDPWLDTNLEPTDPGWVGAWWLCFLFSGVVSIFLSIPFFMFPRVLPDSHLVKKAREEEMAKKYHGAREETDFGSAVKSFPTHLKQVFTSPSWLFVTIALTASVLVLSGMVSFAPKYIESQFGLTASTASFTTGAVAIPSAGLGVLAGALLIYFTKSSGRGAARISSIISLLSIFPLTAFIIHCPVIDLAGVTTEYPDGSLNTALNSSCTFPCNCTSTIFEPVCGADGVSYFSPCRAGCKKTFINNDPGRPVFENCTCIAERMLELVSSGGGEGSSESLLSNSTASDGRCEEPGCRWRLALFLTLVAIALFFIFAINIPDIIITIRSVADEQRSLALGAQSLIFRAFGSIPGPIIFGAIFDSACIFFQDECGRRGNCWVYNNRHLSERALILALFGSSLNIIFSFLAWWAYPKTQPDREKTKDSESSASGSVGTKLKKKLFLFERSQSHTSQEVMLQSMDDVPVESPAVESETTVIGGSEDLHGARARREEPGESTFSKTFEDSLQH